MYFSVYFIFCVNIIITKKKKKDNLIKSWGKSNEVVAVDKFFYISRTFDIADDKSKLLKISSDPTLKKSFDGVYGLWRINIFSLRSSMITHIFAGHSVPNNMVPSSCLS